MISYQTSTKPNPRRRTVRWLRAGSAGVATTALLAAVAGGCLERPVGQPGPLTTNVVVDHLAIHRVERIDLLFMIDNSISMADKQEMLGQAVPMLLSRLIDPACVDPDTEQVVQNTRRWLPSSTA